MMEKVTRVGSLYDFYGSLLTERQQLILELYYLDDLSLAEVAEQIQVSRQAIHDSLRRSEEQLEAYEEALNLLSTYAKQVNLLSELRRFFTDIQPKLVPTEVQTGQSILGALFALTDSVEGGQAC